MTRIDMTTRAWHEFVKPVLPHVLADKDLPAAANPFMTALKGA